MIVLDFFIVNVALPSMQARLHASYGTVEWVVAGYGLTFSTFLITAGRLGDRIGRRRLFSIGLGVFAVASAGCGLAPDAGVLIAFRLLQGVGGALISPTVLSIIGVTYQGPERVRAIGIYGTVLGVAAASGQLIGGLLIQADPAGLGWRSVFLINLPVAAAALALTPRWVPESKAPGEAPLDWTGTALVTAGLTAVILPLVQGRQYGWPWWSLAGLVAAPIILAAFVVTQIRRRRSGRAVLMDMTMFKERPFATGLVTQMGLWCGQASFFLVLALYLQQGRGLDALQAGLIFTVMAGSYLFASMRSAALVLRFGRRVIGIGALILAAGHGLLLAAVLAEGTGGSVGWLAPGLLLVGLGMGLCIAPLSTVVLSSCEPSRAGATSGALATVQQVGNSVGVAVVSIVSFGALSHGYAHAFALSVAGLALLLIAVAALSRLLPAPAGSVKPGPEETLVRLRQLIGSPLIGVDRSDNWTLALHLPGWDIGLTDVGVTAWASLAEVAGGGCRVRGVGRYGRFWWLSFGADDHAQTAVVLGAHVRLSPSPGGGDADMDMPLLESGYSRA
jgi:EmrB/QacA subfamily drug resistance transporter